MPGPRRKSEVLEWLNRFPSTLQAKLYLDGLEAKYSKTRILNGLTVNRISTGIVNQITSASEGRPR